MARDNTAEPVVIQRENERRVAAATNYNLPVIQLRGERGRLVITGVRTDDGTRCELLVVADVSGSFALYPHGVDRFGVRLDGDGAAAVARFLAGEGR